MELSLQQLRPSSSIPRGPPWPRPGKIGSSQKSDELQMLAVHELQVHLFPSLPRPLQRFSCTGCGRSPRYTAPKCRTALRSRRRTRPRTAQRVQQRGSTLQLFPGPRAQRKPCQASYESSRTSRRQGFLRSCCSSGAGTGTLDSEPTGEKVVEDPSSARTKRDRARCLVSPERGLLRFSASPLSLETVTP